jgi:hypothetical protein
MSRLAGRRTDNSQANMIAWMEGQLGFSQVVATELYQKQLLKTWKPFSELKDDEIDRIIQAIQRDLKESIAKISVTRLKMAVYWVKHQLRTNRPAGQPDRTLSSVTQADLLLLKEQKAMEDEWYSSNKEPDHTPLTLDLASAPKVFDKMKTIFTRICGTRGIPLAYVIRHKIEPPGWRTDPPYGDPDSAYPSHDEEMIARAPILRTGVWRSEEGNETFEQNGPFALTFITNSKKVRSILHAMLSNTGAWQHVKKFAAKQDGRQTWRTLHTHFFGGDKVNLMASEIMTTLKNLYYSGDRANYTFDKYCTAHVEQHNRHTALQEYGVKPLEESMKILYFQDGIKDQTLESVRATIVLGKAEGKFQDFDSVMNMYLTFKRSQKSSTPTTRVWQGARWWRAWYWGRGDPDARKKGLPSQADIDKCTHIKKKRYPRDEYNKFTPAEKAKHWQLFHPNTTPGTGPMTSAKRSASSIDSKLEKLTTAVTSAVSVISSLSNTTAKLVGSSVPDSPASDDMSNRNNPALACQGQIPKKNRTE